MTRKVVHSFLIIGITINILIWGYMLSGDFEVGLLMGTIGNLPIILAFVSALLYRSRQDKISKDIDIYIQSLSNENTQSI